LSAEQERDREANKKLRAETQRLERAGLDVVEVSDTSRIIRPIIGWKYEKDMENCSGNFGCMHETP
jgi:hypothetical protein